jgi:hypothetical protein
LAGGNVMKLLVELLVNNKTEWEVVEANSAEQAINQSRLGFSFDSNGKPIITDDEIGFMGVYEISQINLLDFTCDVSNIHSFYHKKLTGLGINPLTFEPLEQEENDE